LELETLEVLGPIPSFGFALVSFMSLDFLYSVPSNAHLDAFVYSLGKAGGVENPFCIAGFLKGEEVIHNRQEGAVFL
jgi:hypothetical protein